jgi:hypothetical protein
MISGALGTAQLGLAELGTYEQLESASGPPVPSGNSKIINPNTLDVVVLPNVYQMMGIWKVFDF